MANLSKELTDMVAQIVAPKITDRFEHPWLYDLRAKISVLNGEDKPPHKTDCSKCDEARSAAKEWKRKLSRH
jgi:hypothetical protein